MDQYGWPYKGVSPDRSKMFVKYQLDDELAARANIACLVKHWYSDPIIVYALISHVLYVVFNHLELISKLLYL